MRVAILGRTKILYSSIEKIIENGDEIVLIGTCKAAPEYDIMDKDFENKARELGIPFFNSSKINSPEIINLMKRVNADVAISVNWLTIIEQEAIKCFKHGILNAHCGDLPKYRGNACPNWSILKGDSSYAISIHYMEAGELDSGDVLLKKYYSIDKDTTISDIYDNMETEIPVLFCEAVTLLKNGAGIGKKQSTNILDSLRCYPRIPTDSFIDWNESCENIMRNIRASSHPFQGAFCYWNNRKIYFHEAKAKPFPAPCYVYPGQVININRESHEVEIAASDGVIILSFVIIEGKEYNSTDVLNSTRIRLNYCIPEEIYLLKKELQDLREEIKMLIGNCETGTKLDSGSQ